MLTKTGKHRMRNRPSTVEEKGISMAPPTKDSLSLPAHSARGCYITGKAARSANSIVCRANELAFA